MTVIQLFQNKKSPNDDQFIDFEHIAQSKRR